MVNYQEKNEITLYVIEWNKYNVSTGGSSLSSKGGNFTER